MPLAPRAITPLAAGSFGVWTGGLDALPIRRAQEAVGELEEQGWAALWFGEAYGREAFTAAASYLAASSHLVVATGIANVWTRDAMATNAAARTLAAGSGGRFLLGLGVSHQPLVERMRGHVYTRPLSAMREYLTAMDAATCLSAEGQDPAPPRLLAALGPKMVALARDQADGAHPYLVTPEQTARIRATLGPERLLAVEQAVVLTGDQETAHRRAHTHLEIYTGLPNYRHNWLRGGFEEADLVRGGSPRLRDAMVAWGDVDTVLARARAHLDAGATHVCLQVLGDTPAELPMADCAQIAAALPGG